MARLFDVYIAVDWSSSDKPSRPTPTKDAIWVGERMASDVADSTLIDECYFRTRSECHVHVHARLLHHAQHRRRVFIGFDFAYGYPSGFAAALGFDHDLPPWRLIWNELTRRIVDEADNRNNRFEVAAELNSRCGGPIPGPFWGCPKSRERPTLSTNRPAFPYKVEPALVLSSFRQVEKKLRRLRAQETWKLFYPGSVGGQALTGIPVVCRLRYAAELAAFSRVWPFETAFTPEPTPDDGPFVLHVEIFPNNVPGVLDPGIPDQAQVRGVVRWLSKLDADGQLGTLFARPDDLTQDELHTCTEEEGWIIGS